MARGVWACSRGVSLPQHTRAQELCLNSFRLNQLMVTCVRARVQHACLSAGQPLPHAHTRPTRALHPPPQANTPLQTHPTAHPDDRHRHQQGHQVYVVPARTTVQPS
jgi:hypothetical protein